MNTDSRRAPLTLAARAVLDSLGRLAAGHSNVTASYSAIQADTGLGRASVASGIAQLRAAGLLTQRKEFGASCTYQLAAGHSTVTASSSATTHAQSSSSSVVRTTGLLDDCIAADEENTSTCTSSSAIASEQTTELLNYWRDFESRVGHLLDEWLIRGRKRRTLAAAIVALAQAGTIERDKILDDLRAIRAGAVERATSNATGLTIHIVEEYAETGQIALFDVPQLRYQQRGSGDDTPSAQRIAASEAAAERYLAKVARRGGPRQVSYTPEQRKDAAARAQQRLAARAGVTA